MASSWIPGMNGPVSEHAGSWQRLSGGLAAKSPDMEPDKGGSGANKSNAYLENFRGQRVYMWLNEVTSNFSMAGTTAQSKKRREFYAHNFVQPVISIAGQTPNTYQFNRISEFIRESHLNAMNDGDNLLLLRIIARGEDTVRPVIRGRRQHIAVDGYVNLIDRGAERFINAPDFAFDFTVARVLKLLGITDGLINHIKFEQILDIVQNPPKGITYEEGGQPDPGRGTQENPEDRPGLTQQEIDDILPF